MRFGNTHVVVCGIEELPAKGTAYDVIVSMLDPGAMAPSCLDGAPAWHQLRFDDVIAAAPDKRVPTQRDVVALLDIGNTLAIGRSASILVHCHLGVSRSTAGAMILLAQREPDRIAALADFVLQLRPRPWPNGLLLALADDVLGLGGALVEQGRAVRRAIAVQHADWVDWLATTHRAAEVVEARQAAHDGPSPR